ncbi:MFS transporter [Pseudaminobacter sp. 19-2017]|uniref:MFS transporter n=1 Tax=Pseudaminobacter soli (ex Zhang et al. 2022) TaxID=2831468 RepID=A0A942I1G3_9HYPH|nr:MFS transporter [Pseudaminobacter soli]MBS3647028.1 MFS transporter [Pseudaminobacter soli]
MSLPPLTPEQSIKPRHFELRISLLFAAVFVSMGTHVPYFPLWLEAHGFDAEQIAVILSAPLFLRVVTTPLITAWADKARDRANILILLTAAALVASLAYFLPPTYLLVLLVSLGFVVFWTPHSPLADSLALSGVRRFGSNYTRMRMWGSMSYLSANLVGGIVLSLTSSYAVPAMLSAGLAMALIAALFAPRLGRPRRASPLSAADMHKAGPKLFNAYFLLFVAGAGIINGSHAFLFSFGSIYWKSIGLNDTVIGILWAWAVVAEVAMFMLFTRLLAHRPATTSLTAAGIAAAVRWIAFPLVWPSGAGVVGFAATQTLHSLSTALVIIGVQKLIGEAVPEERTGTAQGIAFFANGLSMAAFTLISGPLYASFGVGGFYPMAAVAMAGTGLIWAARRLGRPA